MGRGAQNNGTADYSRAATAVGADSANAPRKSVLQRLSNRIHGSIHGGFYRLGRFCSERPGTVILVCFLFALAGGSGWSQVSVEDRPEMLYTPGGSQAFKDKKWTEATFGYGIRAYSVYATKRGGGNLLAGGSKAGLHDLFRVQDAIEQTTAEATVDGTKSVNGLADLCVPRPGAAANAGVAKCARSGTLAFWQFSSAQLAGDADVLSTVSQASVADCCALGAGNIVHKQVLGSQTPAPASSATTGAGAFVLTFYLKNELIQEEEGAELVDPRADAWEKKVDARLRSAEFRATLDVLDLHPFSTAAWDESAEGALMNDLSKVFAAYLIVLAYAAYVLSQNNCVGSHANLALFCVGCVLLAVWCGFGIVIWCGVPYTFVVNSAIFLLLGLGVDDAFVIMAAVNRGMRETPDLEVPELMGRALAVAGASILLTSVTDFVAFAVGSTTSVRALEYYCLFSAVAVMVDFVFQITLFVVAAQYDVRRRRRTEPDCSNCCCCVPCRKPVRDPEAPCFSCRRASAAAKASAAADPGPPVSWAQRYVGERLPAVILSPAGKAGVVAATLVLVALGAFGCARVEMDFQYEWFIPDGDWVKSAVRVQNEHFVGLNLPSAFYTKEADYFDAQAGLAAIEQGLAQSKWVLEGSVDSWYAAFLAWMTARHSGELDSAGRVAQRSDFFQRLAEFLQDDAGRAYDGRVRWDDPQTKTSVVASEIRYFFVDADTAQENIDSMHDTRKIAALAPALQGISYTFPMLFWEGLVEVQTEIVRNVLLAAACIFLVCLALLASLQISVIVLGVIALLDVCLLGGIWWTGDFINMVTAINLLLALGLSIDYAAHICHSFMIQRGTRDERARLALQHIGASVFNGGFTTFLATMMLSVSESYVFQVFFRMLVLIVVLAQWFGLIFLPVLLSFVGPPPYEEGIMFPGRSVGKAADAAAVEMTSKDGRAGREEAADAAEPAEP
jgi:predicted RND superfamily exporter protein